MSVKITWFGHATLGIEVEQFHILIDPFFANNPTAVVNAEDVAADFILVTHGHGDHIGDTVAIAKRTGALVISNAEICAWLKKQGVLTHAQHIGGGHQHPFGYLKLTQAVHGSALPDGSYGGNPAGFLLRMANGKHIYLAGDTGLFGDMRLIGEEGIALAVLPIAIITLWDQRMPCGQCACCNQNTSSPFPAAHGDSSRRMRKTGQHRLNAKHQPKCTCLRLADRSHCPETRMCRFRTGLVVRC